MHIKVRDWNPFIVFCSALVLQFIAIEPLLGIYDEGIVLLGAEMVSDGKVPYRDFWTMYGPGQFYLTSWLYAIFGKTDLVVRAVGVMEKAAIATLAYMILSKFVSKSRSLAATAVILLMLVYAHVEAFPAFPALALALVSMLLTEKGMRQADGYLFLAGIVTGFVATFRHDLGLYSAVGISATIAFIELSSNPKRYLNGVRQIAVFGAGTLVVFVPVMAFLFHTVPTADLYENLIYIPSKIYPAVRSIPFPKGHALSTLEISAFSVYVPFIVALGVLASELVNKFGGAGFFCRKPNDGWVLVPILLITCVLFTIKGMVRVSFFHMIQAIVLSVILLTIYLPRVHWKKAVGKFFITPCFLLSMTLLIGPTVLGARDVVVGALNVVNGTSPVVANCVKPELPRLRCVGIDSNYLAAAKFIMQKTKPDDRIYVGTARHDKLFANAVAFYFAVERLPAVKWYDLHPGVQSQERIQMQMIDQMRAFKPKIVVLDSQWDNAQEPNDSRLANGSKLLDEYIRKNFVEVQRFGTVQVLEPLRPDFAIVSERAAFVQQLREEGDGRML